MDATYDDFGEELLEDPETSLPLSESEMSDHQEHRISKTSFNLMLMLAFFLDALQAFLLATLSLVALPYVALFINRFIWGGGWFIFYIWFKIKGVSFFERTTATKLTSKIALFFFGALPGAGGIIPDFSIVVTIIYFETRAFDNEKIAKIAGALERVAV